MDLALKILICEDGEGRAGVSENRRACLLERQGFWQELPQNIAASETLANSRAA